MIFNNATNMMLGDAEVSYIKRGTETVWERVHRQIFGFHIDPTKANASQAVTYLADAVGKTPAAMTPTCTLNTYIGVWNIDSDGYPYIYHDEWADAHRLCTQMTNINSGQTIAVNNPTIAGKTVQIWFFTLDSEGKRVLHTPEPVSLPYTFTSSTNTKFFMSIKYQDESEMTPFDITYAFNDFSYGDWGDAFFMPKPCMLRYDGTVAYYLDPNDYTKKLDGKSWEIPMEQGNWWGEVGEGIHKSVPYDPALDDEGVRCRATTPLIIPPRTRVAVKFPNPDVQISGYVVDENNIVIAAGGTGPEHNPLYGGWKDAPRYIDNTNSDESLRIYLTARFAENAPILVSDLGGNSIVYEASDITNSDFNGNAMIEWPKIWYKFVQGTADGEGEFYCADHQVDSSYHCWCNYDADNNIIDHFYTAIYNGCVIDGKMRSLSGVQLSSNASNNTTNKSMSDDIAYAEANNSGTNKDWYINVFSDMSLITALTMMIFHRIDMNRIITIGGLARDATYTTGTSDDRGLFYGIPDTASETKIFGMENYIGYMYRWVAGVGSNTYYEIGLKYTRGSADGTGISDYNIYAHYYLVDTDELIPITSGHITKMWFRDGGIYPRETREPSSFDPADNDRYYNTGYAMPTDLSSYAVLVIRSGNEFNRYSPYQGYSIIGAALTCKPVKGGHV